MYRYLVWGRVLQVREPLDWRPAGGAPQFFLRQCDGIFHDGEVIHKATDLDQPEALVVSRNRDSIRIFWREHRVLVESDSVFYLPQPGIEAFIDRVVFPVLETLDGWLTLHAAAATSPSGQTMVFLGESGVGKSTTVSQLCANGWTIRADDIVSIETPNLLRPSSSSIRLRTTDVEKFDFPNSGKMRVLCEPQIQSVPIDRLVILKRGPLSLDLVPNPFVSLLPFLMDLTDWEPERRGRRITMLAQLLSKVPVFQLSFPASESSNHPFPQISLLENI